MFVQLEDIHTDDRRRIGPVETIHPGTTITVDHGNGWDSPPVVQTAPDGMVDPDGEPYSWIDENGRGWHNCYIVAN